MDQRFSSALLADAEADAGAPRRKIGGQRRRNASRVFDDIPRRLQRSARVGVRSHER
jgi:hypothetical protein